MLHHIYDRSGDYVNRRKAHEQANTFALAFVNQHFGRYVGWRRFAVDDYPRAVSVGSKHSSRTTPRRVQLIAADRQVTRHFGSGSVRIQADLRNEQRFLAPLGMTTTKRLVIPSEERDLAESESRPSLWPVKNLIEARYGLVVALDHAFRARGVQIQPFGQTRRVRQNIGARRNST